jgi:uncharacterized membrane protein YeaQ/YmgE (transglycosylase-associated protein family)
MKGDKQEEAVCPNCAYSVEGVGLISCPECGYTGPSDRLVDRRFRIRLLAPLFFASSILCGFCLYIVGFVVSLALEYDKSPGPMTTWILGATLVSPLLGLVGAFVFLLMAHRFAQASADFQRRLVIVCILPGAIGAALFVIASLFGIGIIIWAATR